MAKKIDEHSRHPSLARYHIHQTGNRNWKIQSKPAKEKLFDHVSYNFQLVQNNPSLHETDESGNDSGKVKIDHDGHY